MYIYVGLARNAPIHVKDDVLTESGSSISAVFFEHGLGSPPKG